MRYTTKPFIVFFVTCISFVYSMEYQIIDLGLIPEGISSQAHAMNNVGQVTGRADTETIHGNTFLWQNGTMKNLGTYGYDNSVGLSINNSGQIVGYAQDLSPTIPNVDYVNLAYIKDACNSEIRLLGTLGGNGSWATDINESEQVVGGSHRNFNESIGAFLWQNGTMFDLGVVDGFDNSVATDINNSGQVVGYSFKESGENVAFLWTEDNGMISLDMPIGMNWSSSSAINDYGQIAGKTKLGTFEQNQVTLWDNGKIYILGEGQAMDMNNSAQIVGFDNNHRAALFNADGNGQMIILNDLIDDSLSWDLRNANAINDAGWIAGWGVYDGTQRAFLMKPVPEPATLLILALGGLILRRTR